ncbi:isoeugenol monooxygenase [Colletotrichum acutatum]
MSLDYPSYTSGKRLSNNTKVFKVLTKHTPLRGTKPTQAPFFAHGDRTTEPDKVRSCAAHLAAQYPINVTRQALSAEGLPVNVAEPDVPEADGFLITMVDNMELGGNEMSYFAAAI